VVLFQHAFLESFFGLVAWVIIGFENNERTLKGKIEFEVEVLGTVLEVIGHSGEAGDTMQITMGVMGHAEEDSYLFSN
jgi:ribosomal protein S28E/S33